MNGELFLSAALIILQLRHKPPFLKRIACVVLGKRLGVSEGAVRRLFDLDHKSHIGNVCAALTLSGKRLIVEVHDAA